VTGPARPAPDRRAPTPGPTSTGGATSTGATRSDPASTLVNGARSLIRTLVDSGVDVCFANPGTSEMHFVAALDAVPEMRPVLGLFEGVVTGAADGYGRMTGRPAAALLHLGPGLGNGLANLHNARRAHTPIVAVVGDHATYHKRLDAPLESDIDALAGSVSGWVGRSWRPGDVGADAAEAVAAARTPPGGIATLILPADVSWGEGGRVAPRRAVPAARPVADTAVAAAARALQSGEPAVLLVGGAAVSSASAQVLVAEIAAQSGARLICETFPARMRRGVGTPRLSRLAYLGEAAAAQLAGARHLILAGSAPPVSFFAYPGRPGDLVPEGCVVHSLALPGDDILGALAALRARLGARGGRRELPEATPRPPLPTGPLDAGKVAAAVGALLPEDAIVVDEAITSGGGLGPALAGAPPHDLLTLTGGAIGFGLPAAAGAAVACPGRPVVCLQADGSALYTISALWTHAREGLDVTTILLNNRSYAILAIELDRVEAGTPGPRASSLLDLTRPDLDFVSIAEGMGVPGAKATTGEELVARLREAQAEPGPHLVEAMLAA
jgi:acetolactate synthase-1/2/3 large subunit